MEQNNKQIAVRPVKKTAVMIRREMVKIPAVINALEPVEKAVFLASTAKTIAEFTPAELAAELEMALKWICKDVGYRSPDESDRQYLVIRTAEILKRYYADLSLKDFRMAFEMSITGELDDYLPKGRDGQAERGHYQQFNAEYVCKILNAYKYKRAAVLKKANDVMPPESEKPVTPEQVKKMMNRTKRDCIQVFEQFKVLGYMPEISPIGEMLYYALLTEAGLAPEIKVTPDEQRAIMQRKINEFARRGMVSDVRILEQAGPGAPELQRGAFTIARKKALKAAFEKMVADGIELTDYIKFE